MTSVLRVDLVAAARPNFIKIARLYHALAAAPWCEVCLVHTGQHYDANMSQAFFDTFELPVPDLHLNIGSGTHGEQTGRTLMAYEQACATQPPDWTIVVGDVNATVACALAATKLGVRVAHLEAGLRSGDRTMPEEINRVVVDAIADLLWTPSVDADANLAAEGIPAARIERVGNIMIDTFMYLRDRIAACDRPQTLGLDAGRYVLVTFHRPVNVDDPRWCWAMVAALCDIADRLPIVWPLHPRTAARLEATGLRATLEAHPHIQLIAPERYIAFMSLASHARCVVTDSGGIQEETTVLGIPCFTVRDTTERPITISQGSNNLIRIDELVAEIDKLLSSGDARRTTPAPALWDGHTAARVVESLRRYA